MIFRRLLWKSLSLDCVVVHGAVPHSGPWDWMLALTTVARWSSSTPALCHCSHFTVRAVSAWELLGPFSYFVGQCF